MKQRAIALARVGDREVMHPRLVHRGYGLKREDQARMSHAEQASRLLKHIQVLVHEIAHKGETPNRLRALQQARDNMRFHDSFVDAI